MIVIFSFICYTNKKGVLIMDQKKKSGIVIGVLITFILVIVTVVILLFSTNIISFNFNKTTNESKEEGTVNFNKTTNEPKEEGTVYDVTNYVSYINSQGTDSTTGSDIKEITFKNLNRGLTRIFENKQNEFKQKLTGDTNQKIKSIYKSTVNAEINDAVLSVYFNGSSQWLEENPDRIFHESFSANIDLKNSLKVTTDEILAKYNVSKETMIKAILNDIASKVNTDILYLNNQGGFEGDYISILDFKNNISEYVRVLNNRIDDFATVYVKGNKLYCDYKDHETLALLDMGTHMGIGLLMQLQTLSLS